MKSKFFKRIFWKPVYAVFFIIAALASIFSWVGFCSNCSLLERMLITIAVFIFIQWIATIASSYKALNNSYLPIKIRNAIEGKHHYKNKVIFVTDKCEISPGQLLMLYIKRGDIEEPLAIATVDGYTTIDFPQVVITPDFDINFFLEQSLWPSLFLKSEILSQHMKGNIYGNN